MTDIVYDLTCADTETTGLDHQKDEIVEITVIEFNLSGAIGRVYTTMCKPMSGHIPKGASDIHGITYDMVKDSPNYLTDGVREAVADFIGDRPVLGHNIIDFDSKFMRITFKKMIDSLKICREKYRGGNNLKSACKRLNIKWDDSKAHRSEYDVKKTIELYCKVRALEEAEAERKSDTPMFAIPKEVQEIIDLHNDPSVKPDITNSEISAEKETKLGIIPSEKDKDLLASQTYSFSRLRLFNQCAFKWYMQYIKKLKEPDRIYFMVGKICHKIAEWSGEWCYREQFNNKFESYVRVKDFRLNQDNIRNLAEKFNKKEEEVTIRDFALFIGKNPGVIPVYFPGTRNVADLIYKMDKSIPEDSYEKPSMPDIDSYTKIIDDAINYYKCSDPDVINDCKKIMGRFYKLKDFSTTPGDLSLTEKKLVFDKNWNPLKDFFANDAFFRGIIDVISYYGEYVVITDYKTSRKMLTVEQLKEDRQMMTYVLLVCMFLPKGSFKKIVIRIEYIRFGEVIEYEIENPEETAKNALNWINSTVQNIEKEMLKTDGTAFQPIRNEFCHTCFLGEEGMCPLFNKNISGKLDDPFNCSVSTIDECRAAWKRIETNKSENSRLTKLCKSFVNQCENPITIDQKAILDIYLNKFREYDTFKTLNLLLKDKKLQIMDIVYYLNISPSQMKKLIDDKGITLSPEELSEISKVKSKTTFEAFTPEEAAAQGFINS